MSDVFISYSRLDKEFVGKLHESLIAKDQTVWVDWEDIPPSQSWWDEIQKGIARANNIVLILSPYSMGSVVCHMEIEYARSLKKRIIPVLHAPYERDACVGEISKRLAKPEEFTTREIWGTRQPLSMYDANDGDLKHINFFFFGNDDDFKTKFESLFEIIHTDYAHKEQHTTFLLRASEWNRRGRDVSFLLLDTELEQAEIWLKSSQGKQPPPTELQLAYIQASEKRTRQLHNIRRASIIGSLVAVVALIFAIGASLIGVQATQSANLASTREVSANIQIANANGQLTAVPPTLTQVNKAVVTAQSAADIANTAVGNANGQLTAVPPTLTQVNKAVVTAQGAAAIANTAVGNAQATAAQIPPTLTQAAIVQEIVVDFSNVIFEVDNPAGQIDNMNKIVEKYPNQAIAYEARGAYYDKRGELDLAINDYTQALALNSSASDVYALRANLLGEKGDMEGALADYDRAIDADPQNSNAYANRGTTRNNMGDSTGALEDLNKAISLDPQIASYYALRGIVRNDIGDHENAIADFNKAISLEPKNSAIYFNRGAAYDNIGDFQAAIADYTQAIALDPENADIYSSRGSVYEEMNDPKSAIEDYDQAINRIPDNADYYINRGMARYKLSDFKSAIEDYDQAIALDPQNATAYNLRGASRVSQNDFKDALAYYNQAITLDPEQKESYSSRGYLYFMLYKAETDKAQALMYLKNAVSDYQTAESLGYEVTPNESKILQEAQDLLATATPKP